MAVAATSISLMTSTTMVVFEFFQKKRSNRRPRIRAWLLGSWEQCSLEEEEASFVFPTKSFWMHQKLWRKFAIIEVALAFYCALAGMARGRASIQFTKLPQVVPVWWTFPIITKFPKQQLPPQEKKSHCKIMPAENHIFNSSHQKAEG